MLRLLLAALFPPRPTEAIVAEATYDGIARKLAPREVGNITALLPYRYSLVRALILEAKYKGNVKAQEFLGRILAEYLQETLAEGALHGTTSYTLVPIPLSKERLQERGYNQAERIAATASKLTGVKVEQFLTRTRDTLPQTTLRRRERLANMEGAFQAHPIDSETTYLLIDDVVTTGATLQAATSALVGRCIAVALAY